MHIMYMYMGKKLDKGIHILGETIMYCSCAIYAKLHIYILATVRYCLRLFISGAIKRKVQKEALLQSCLHLNVWLLSSISQSIVAVSIFLC